MDSGLPRANGRSAEEPARLLAGGANPFATEALQLREIFGILRRRLAAVLVTWLVLVTGAGLWLMASPRLYQATAAVMIVDARRSLAGPILNEPTGRGVGRLTDPIRSLIEVIRGRAVLGMAVDREGLRLVSATGGFQHHLLASISIADTARIEVVRLTFSPQRLVARARGIEVRAAYGEPVHLGGITFTVGAAPAVEAATLHVLSRDAAIDAVANVLRVLPRPGTDVIELTYSSTDPVTAQRVVNTAAGIFQRYNQQMVQQQTRLRRAFLEGQLRSTESELAAANQALNSFRQSRQIYRPTEQLNAQQQALMSLDIQRSEIDADREMYRSLIGTLQSAAPGKRGNAIRTLVSSPGMASNPVISQLYAQLVAQESALEERTAGPLGSTAANPDVERLKGLVAATELKVMDASRSYVASLEARLAALDDLRGRKLTEMQALPAAEAEEDRLLQDVHTVGTLADAIRADLEKARMAEAIETGQVEILDLAPRAWPVHAGRAKRLALAGILGLLFGAGAAFALEFMDGTIRRRREVEGILQLPCLTWIPPLPGNGAVRRWLRVPGLRGRNGRRPTVPPAIITPTAEFAGGAEAFRRLRNNLFLPPSSVAGRTVLVTSPLPAEGKTLTAANLAIAVARQGRRVLLVDTDLQRPALHDVFRLPSHAGIRELLLGQASALEAIMPTGVENLFVLSAGERNADAGDPFDLGALRGFLSGSAATYDVVILDAPPVLAAADVISLATVSDGVLLVLRAGATRPDAALRAVQELRRAGAHILGAVLADPDRKVLEDSYGYPYSFGAPGAPGAGGAECMPS